ASAIDRGSMVRIPLGNSRSARVEVRSIAPDSNPYATLYSVLKAGLEGSDARKPARKPALLPDNIYDAIDLFARSKFAKELFGSDVHEKFIAVKRASADRCPRLLGNLIKQSEIQFHHEVQNQFLWNEF
ncbi:MAG TPA: hypothetical protein VKQ72_14380, partial [Aggregatilineales bacterium]|nr:hypothetical protein [Aggregatilineales bacterium]